MECSTYFTRVFSPRCGHDQEDPGNEVDNSFPWTDVCVEEIVQWLNCYSICHRTAKEVLLMVMMTTRSSLLGNSTIRVYDNDPFEEKANLHTIIIGPSGIGKTPAARHGCRLPLTEHLEAKVNKTMWTDEPTENSLFNFFVTNDDVVPMLCIDEATEFLQRTVTQKGRKGMLEMSRMCKLYDGDSWFMLKGAHGKRKGISEAHCAFLALCTAKEFLSSIWPTAIAAKNGFSDRTLLYYRSESQKAMLTEVREELRRLKEEYASLQNLYGVYEDIYIRHNSGSALRYTLSYEAKDIYIKHIDQAIPSQETNSRSSAGCNHKVQRNILKAALNLHVLYNRIANMLNSQANPIPTQISADIMNNAIVLIEFLKRLRAISELVS